MAPGRCRSERRQKREGTYPSMIRFGGRSASWQDAETTRAPLDDEATSVIFTEQTIKSTYKDANRECCVNSLPRHPHPAYPADNTCRVWKEVVEFSRQHESSSRRRTLSMITLAQHRIQLIQTNSLFDEIGYVYRHKRTRKVV